VTPNDGIPFGWSKSAKEVEASPRDEVAWDDGGSIRMAEVP